MLRAGWRTVKGWLGSPVTGARFPPRPSCVSPDPPRAPSSSFRGFPDLPRAPNRRFRTFPDLPSARTRASARLSWPALARDALRDSSHAVKSSSSVSSPRPSSENPGYPHAGRDSRTRPSHRIRGRSGSAQKAASPATRAHVRLVAGRVLSGLGRQRQGRVLPGSTHGIVNAGGRAAEAHGQLS